MDPASSRPLPKAVFFDVGDTLLDTSAMLDSAIFTALVPVDATRTIDEVRQAVASSSEAMPSRQPPFYEVKGNVTWWLERYRAIGEALGLAGEDLMRFLATVTESHFRGDALHVVPDAPSTLARLAARGVRLGVISNWDDTLEPILTKKGLRRFFAVVVASTALGMAKPERGIFQHALREIGAEADESWHVGDDPNADALGAIAAGMSAVLLDPYRLYKKLESRGVVCVRSLTEGVDRILGETTP